MNSQMTSQQEMASRLFFCLFVCFLKKLDQRSCCNKEKNQLVCFSVRFDAGTIQFSQWKNTALPLGPNCQVHKNMLPCIFRFCKGTPRPHCTIPQEKRSGESVLWALTAIPLVTLIRSNYTFTWFFSKKWQTACFFQKTKIVD